MKALSRGLVKGKDSLCCVLILLGKLNGTIFC